MERPDCAIISPAWTHSYESRRDFRRSSPGHRDRFRAHRSHTWRGADAHPCAFHYPVMPAVVVREITDLPDRAITESCSYESAVILQNEEMLAERSL